jgi:hypothetical protein
MKHTALQARPLRAAGTQNRIPAHSSAGVPPAREFRTESHHSLAESAFGHDFSGIPVQPKLTINPPGDRFEQEAERVANQVMRMPTPVLFPARTCPSGKCNPRDDEDLIQAQCLPPGVASLTQRQPYNERRRNERDKRCPPRETPDLDARMARMDGSGHPLSLSARNFFETRFGYDFSRVRIHTTALAADTARSINARAFTSGRTIVFGSHEYRPEADSGRRLIAHELCHVVQQGAAPERPSGPGGVQRSTLVPNRTASATIQRQCPAGVTFNIGNHPAHVPSCGTQALTASAQPANIPNLAWSLQNDTVAVDANTTIAANGVITIAAAQNAGNIKARATRPAVGNNPSCWAEMTLPIRSHPTGITSTRVVGPPSNPAQDYGAVFEHVFTSNDGNVASLENVAVGERFPNIPNPTGAQHNNIPSPFGPFSLNTATLTPNASNNWFLTSAGELGGTHDNVTFQKAGVNVGQFLLSTSNPNPPNALPVSFALDQDFHWYCRLSPAANRWTRFHGIQHERGLRQTGGNVEFFTKANQVERAEPYTGQPGIINARAVPNRVTRSPAAGPANTVTVRSDTLPDPLPAGHGLLFSIQGAALGSNVNANTGVFTAGQAAGQVRVRVRDSVAANNNHDETTITIV